MQEAWTWASNNKDLLTQLFFWSSVKHGTQVQDAYLDILHNYGEEPVPGKSYYFDLPVYFVAEVNEIYDFFEARNDPDGYPYFEVTGGQLLSDLSVTLNGRILPLIDVQDASTLGETRYFYRFALDGADVAELAPGGNSCIFSWTGAFDFVSGGITVGNQANEVPEPATLVFIAAAGLALAQHRRT
jgi:hypothetical protein